MRVKTTVTEKKLAANRRNAKKSTGPRTERGKNTSRFNALTTGLFAEHVVIPECDGDDPDEQFSKLLDALEEEYKPEGASETSLVALMAECIWKQRRLGRSERGLILAHVRLQWKSSRSEVLAEFLTYEISILERAQKEIKITRTLSPETYAFVRIILDPAPIEGLPADRLEASNDSPSRPTLDDQFVASLEEAKVEKQDIVCFLRDKKKLVSDYYAARALPAEGDMDQILRYDKALQKKFDWALERLLESQARRRTAQPPAAIYLSSNS